MMMMTWRMKSKKRVDSHLKRIGRPLRQETYLMVVAIRMTIGVMAIRMTIGMTAIRETIGMTMTMTIREGLGWEYRSKSCYCQNWPNPPHLISQFWRWWFDVNATRDIFTTQVRKSIYIGMKIYFGEIIN